MEGGNSRIYSTKEWARLSKEERQAAIARGEKVTDHPGCIQPPEKEAGS